MIEPAAAYAYCREVACRAGTVLSFGFRQLPPPKRDAACAAIAFCRVALSPAAKQSPAAQQDLIDWEAALEGCYQGTASHPITVALADAARRHDVPAQAYRDLIRGWRVELECRRYRTFEELMDRYCTPVAHAAAAIAVQMLGSTSPAAPALGRDLAAALLLTGILQEVHADAGRGRICLPLLDLQQFGVREQALVEGRPQPGLSGLLQLQIERARSYLRRAAALPQHLEADARPCARCLAAACRMLLDRIEHAGPAILRRSVQLGPWAKLLLRQGRNGDRHRIS